MLTDQTSLEDLILFLAGTSNIAPGEPFPTLKSSDYSLIYSFSKQIGRKIGFTDRQYELAKTKVDDYQSSFHFIPNLEEVKNTTRLPIREIDRARWIKIEYHDNNPVIAVRFTFQKKLISAIEGIRSKIKEKTDYDKVNKIHYFAYSERNLFDIVEAFKESNFQLDKTVQTIYNKLILLNPNDHLPGIYDLKIKNLHPAGVEIMQSELGQLSKENLLLYRDRAFKYGLQTFDAIEDDWSLEYKLAHRRHPNVIIDNTKWNIDKLLLALENLQRYPVLMLVPQQACHDIIVSVQKYIKNIIAPEDISVVFRLDNQGDGVLFNNYIKDQQINNKVDKNTKIVYSLDNKIPKPLLTSSWSPQTIIVCGNTSSYVNTRKVLDCFSDKDLILYYGDQVGAGRSQYYRREFDKI